MAIKMTDSDPPIGDVDVDGFERRTGVTLPPQYRRWLLAHNGGRPDPSRFNYKGESGPYTDSLISLFFSLSDMEADITQFKVWQQRMPDELVPIADDPFGNRICIGTAGPHEGKVYFWDHEEEQDEPTYDNCHLLADSFEEFLNGLH